jgi:tRNA pseudouridine38-40 synthase
MRNLRLDLCYEGTRYRGWQRLSNTDNTIQFKLETALSKILGEPIEVVGSGRTDAGTHALRQTANFHCNSTMPAEEICFQLRKYLPEDIGIYFCKDVSERFHARLNAKTKTYRYRIWNSTEPCVFDRKFVYIDSEPMDVEAMSEAARRYLGQHDFSAFCVKRSDKKSTVRYIHAFTVEKVGNEIIFTVNGNGFLHHMVRIMVGTLVEIGKHQRDMDSIDTLYGAKRSESGLLLPACGLCLMEVNY